MSKIKKLTVPHGTQVQGPSQFVDGDTNHLHPAFSFRHTISGYRLSNGDTTDLGRLAARIEQISQLSWQQLMFNVDRHKFEKIPQAALNSIPAGISPDMQFYSINFGELRRIIGYRKGKVFHVIWLDYRGECYSH